MARYSSTHRMARCSIDSGIAICPVSMVSVEPEYGALSVSLLEMACHYVLPWGDKMKMIKLLQGAVVGMFVLFALVGLAVLFFLPDRLDAFGKLVGILFPVFLAQVIPALIGSPLTDIMRAKADAIKQAANPNQGIVG
jgi:hypothetical protein